ncbi:MAG: sulfotransferase [Halioglobus sp.]|nr:sulfotransferase [Halioglobus sp.]
MGEGEEIRITDLANPLRSEVQRSALAYAETLEIELTSQSILQEASQVTGLDDFGQSDFLQRLELLCDEWGRDKGLVNLGRLSLRNKLLQHAKSRLLIQDVLTRYPEIHAVEIRTPIIVAGLPRSGTTHLVNLMAADTRLRSLPLWESYEPIPLAGEALREDGVDPRYQRCEDTWQMMQSLSPLLAAMHPMSPDHIHEELELMGPDFASYNYEWLSVSPRWRDHYYACDQTPHYEYMKTVLKILTWQDGDVSGVKTRWLLKCPQHLEQLSVLQQVFPDATIAITHRDPVSVIQSAATMLAYGQRINRKEVDLAGLMSYWTDRVAHLLRACVRDRESLPAERSIDVLFHEFMADDLAMVEKIYAKAELDMTAHARGQLQSYVDEHPRGKDGRVIYNLQDDFDVEPAQLRALFDFYTARFPVEVEVS